VLISCLCSAEAPLERVKVAIERFGEQTYGERELIVTPSPLSRRGNKAALVRFVESLRRDDVRVGGEPRGELWCAWSATASSHPERLRAQARELAAHEAGGCALADWLVCTVEDRALFWTGGESVVSAGAAGTLLAEADAFGACAAALEGGFWPDDVVSLRGGAPLLVEFGAPPVERVGMEFARPRLGALAATLIEHRVPRPVLLHVRSADGGVAVLDPRFGEAG